jgi:hypothetical protein
MMTARPFRLLLPVLGLLALTACQQDKARAPAGPNDFALVVPVAPAQGGAVQRISLPPAALAAPHRADLADIRLYDGKGRALSLAFEDAASQAARQTHAFAALPIAAPQDGEQSGVSVRIEDGGRSVAVDAAQALASSERLAVLIDTRALTDPAESIAFTADLPPQVPVNLTVESGSDLRAWDYLGEKVLYRAAEGQPLLAAARLPLHGADLRDRYIRISWRAAPGVAVSGAEVTTTRQRPPERTALATRGGVLADAHNLTFRPALAAPIAAMKVSQTGPDGLVPVKLYGRDGAEQPWVLLAEGTVRQNDKPALLELAGVAMREYRLEADSRSAGFSSAPRLDLLLDPVTVIAALNGVEPYRLAIGNAEAAPAALPVGQLVEPAKIAGLPVARTGGNGLPPVIDLAPSEPDGPFTPRKLTLWGALLLGVAVLAFAAIRLLRSNAQATAE